MTTWYVKNIAIMVREPEREHLGEDAPETVREMISSLSPGETSRNARLIAAAPELLAALESLVGAADNGDGISDRQWRRIEALIERVRGERA
jgi:hypothetical protein